MSWWLITALAAVYEIVGLAVWGATIGKLMVGTRVEVDGGRPSWTSSALRWAIVGGIGFAVAIGSPIVGVIGLVTIVVTYAPILWDARGLGLHNRLAGTVVV